MQSWARQETLGLWEMRGCLTIAMASAWVPPGDQLSYDLAAPGEADSVSGVKAGPAQCTKLTTTPPPSPPLPYEPPYLLLLVVFVP